VTNKHSFNRKHSSWVRNCGWEEGTQYICLVINTGWEYKLPRNLPSPYHILQLHILYTRFISLPKHAILKEITITRIETLVFFISCQRMMFFFLTSSNSKAKGEISLMKIQCQSAWKLNEWRKEWLCLYLQTFRWDCFVVSLFSIRYRALWPQWEESRHEGLCQSLND